MKPTRSEIRGTWMLAAICALVLLASICVTRCGRAPAAETLPLPAVVGGDGSAGASVTDDSLSARQGGKSRKRGAVSASKGENRRKPKPSAPDTPSPLDRPL